VNTETYAVCIGDQINAIDAWIRLQQGFQLSSEETFKSPYNEFACTVDLTWPQYERIQTSSGRVEMRKKERLDPVMYDNNDVEVRLSWNDVALNSIVRAVVPPPSFIPPHLFFLLFLIRFCFALVC
jgi:hypothetical protein